MKGGRKEKKISMPFDFLALYRHTALIHDYQEHAQDDDGATIILSTHFAYIYVTYFIFL